MYSYIYGCRDWAHVLWKKITIIPRIHSTLSPPLTTPPTHKLTLIFPQQNQNCKRDSPIPYINILTCDMSAYRLSIALSVCLYTLAQSLHSLYSLSSQSPSPSPSFGSITRHQLDRECFSVLASFIHSFVYFCSSSSSSLLLSTSFGCHYSF